MKIAHTLLLALGLLGCSLAAQAQRTPVPVMNFENIPVALSTPHKATAEQVRKAFENAVTGTGWTIVAKGQGQLEATYRKGGKHEVVVAVQYGAESYSLRYVSSIDMKYGEGVPTSSYDRTSPGSKTMAEAAAEKQDKLFAAKPEAPYERPDSKAVIHPFYERWVHELLDNVHLRLKAIPGAAP